MKYYVMVRFETEAELECPAAFVGAAVMESASRGNVLEREQRIYVESVKAVDLSKPLHDTTVEAVKRIM